MYARLNPEPLINSSIRNAYANIIYIFVMTWRIYFFVKYNVTPKMTANLRHINTNSTGKSNQDILKAYIARSDVTGAIHAEEANKTWDR